jgi:hypothetical protein
MILLMPLIAVVTLIAVFNQDIAQGLTNIFLA